MNHIKGSWNFASYNELVLHSYLLEHGPGNAESVKIVQSVIDGTNRMFVRSRLRHFVCEFMGVKQLGLSANAFRSVSKIIDYIVSGIKRKYCLTLLVKLSDVSSTGVRH